MTIDATKNVTDLDFEDIRSNFKTFLESQETFKDYDFEGSGLSILLDILAYNTHYQAYYANMVANEMFLDSAAKRSSVASHAKQIGYTAHSRRSSSATVQVLLASSSASSVTIPAKTKFVGKVGSIQYDFVNTSPVVIDTSGNGPFTSETFAIYEGTFKSISYINSETADTKFLIPSSVVDTNHINVRVLKSTSDGEGRSDVWTKVTDITSVTSTSKSFFLELNSTGQYEIIFGDGIVGQKLENGNLVVIDYLETSGISANGMGQTDSSTNRTFTTSIANSIVSVVTSSSMGSEPESIAKIRRNAPRFYQTQNRAVTANDYESLILNEYGNVDDVKIYGGEEANPPQYGKVFISIKPTTSSVLTNDEKQSIKTDILKSKNVVGVIPELIDPDYTYVTFDLRSGFDSKVTSKTQSELRPLLLAYVNLYANTELSKFGSNLYVNQLENLCRNLDPSLQYVDVDIKMEKRLVPDLNVERNYSINFNNPILNTAHGALDGVGSDHSSVQSTMFAYKKPDGTIFLAGIDSDMHGKLRIYEDVDKVRTTVYSDVGDIDFPAGKVSINRFVPQSASINGSIRFTVTPREDVVYTPENVILNFDNTQTNAITVFVEDVRNPQVRTSSRSTPVSSGYSETSSTSSSSYTSSSTSSSGSSSSGSSSSGSSSSGSSSSGSSSSGSSSSGGGSSSSSGSGY